MNSYYSEITDPVKKNLIVFILETLPNSCLKQKKSFSHIPRISEVL
jgi:hypothetical protein